MVGLRIRVDLSDFVYSVNSRRLMYLDTELIRTVADLENKIREEHEECGDMDLVIFMDGGFVVPSWEPIQVLQPEDTIKVTRTVNKEVSSVKKVTFHKRKRASSSDHGESKAPNSNKKAKILPKIFASHIEKNRKPRDESSDDSSSNESSEIKHPSNQRQSKTLSKVSSHKNDLKSVNKKIETSSDSSSSSSDSDEEAVEEKTKFPARKLIKKTIVSKSSSSSSSSSDDDSSDSQAAKKVVNPMKAVTSSKQVKQPSSSSSSSSSDSESEHETESKKKAAGKKTKTVVQRSASTSSSESSSDSSDDDQETRKTDVKVPENASNLPVKETPQIDRNLESQANTEKKNVVDSEGTKRKRKRKRKNKNKNKLPPEQFQAELFKVQDEQPQHEVINRRDEFERQKNQNNRFVFNDSDSSSSSARRGQDNQEEPQMEFSADEIKKLYELSKPVSTSTPTCTSPAIPELEVRMNGHVSQNEGKLIRGKSTGQVIKSQLSFQPRVLTMQELKKGQAHVKSNGLKAPENATKPVEDEAKTSFVQNSMNGGKKFTKERKPGKSKEVVKNVEDNRNGTEFNHDTTLDATQDIYSNQSLVIQNPPDFTKLPPADVNSLEPSHVITFKMIEMSESYTPELSDFKQGTIMQKVENQLTIQILNPVAKKRVGRFELNPEEDVQEETVIQLQVQEIFDTRIIKT